MGRSDMPAEITYSMRFRGQRHVVHMKLKKNMIPENFPVYTTNDQGAEQEDYPFVPRDCYFYSYLEGVPGSQATLDTCNGGLNGMLQVDDFTYEIKPLASSSKFEHIISLLVVEERSLESKRCRNEEQVAEADKSLEETKLVGSPRAAPVYLWRVHVKVLRVHYTMTSTLAKAINNFTHSLEFILVMNSLSDTIYKLSGLAVYVRAVCIWQTKDQIDVERNKHNNMGLVVAFGSFRGKFHNQMKASLSVLITGRKIGNSEYLGYQSTLCKQNRAVSYVNAASRHVFIAAVVMSHANGHVIGLKHDDESCYCFRRSNCLMHEYPVLADMLSNCSQAAVHRRIHEWDECLSENRVQYDNFKYVVPRCGDKKVDENEECDCGSLKECAFNRFQFLIIVPVEDSDLKVPQRMGRSDMPAEITYSMRFRGQRHVVHMKLKKNMIPENFPVYTTNDQGAEQEDYPFVPRDCYFYSYLEGVPGSQATLDTCNGGLNGMLQVDDFTYEIKPLASSSKFEHIISLLVVEERSLESKRCRNEEQVAEADKSLEETKLVGSPRAAPVYLWRVHVKVLRVHYTMTSTLAKAINNFTHSLEFILVMNSLSDTIYKLSGLAVYVRAVLSEKSRKNLKPEASPTVFQTKRCTMDQHANLSEHTCELIRNMEFSPILNEQHQSGRHFCKILVQFKCVSKSEKH
ncbi:Disintegrin and metalloproteinase domain-containing protein 29 [Microtus ochrogaster]|uniref:Disintegrin and metalloproteinase domain-containing protein 29 n=1 Tax=Microtus ochrogaster TaxID=79684 RepID=A0A8J6H1I8_MICOH|nr:Disintegrin and metalloproteinase domain-containing protein 29 [Microtus ochrogaster]